MRVTVDYAPIPHNSQIVTGLVRLARMKRIDLKRRHNDSGFLVRASVDGIPVCFDMRDGDGINAEAHGSVRYYFKRGYSRPHERVRPLGFNYEVHDEYDPVAKILRRPTVRQIAAPPTYTETPPAVLFLTRLWRDTGDPARDAINESRIRLVQSLRKEFGEAFIGGMQPDDFAAANCRDLVVPQRLTRKARYLRLVRSIPICITTVGLHGSNGWKLGEYVAASRAIVSEPLRHVVPGDFADGLNYLSFTTPDQCIDQVARLMANRAERESMMRRNQDYYQRYLKPESLMLNALSQVKTDVSRI